jgi:hypothetical protein
MATDYLSATDSILSKFKVAWDANSPALVGGSAPTVVYESTESDLKPHPRDSGSPWARIVIRHGDGNKVTLNNEAGTARYRRIGIVWVQVFTKNEGAENWTLGQQLAQVAHRAFEGERFPGGVFTKTATFDRPRDGAWITFDVKANFYWDEIR